MSPKKKPTRKAKKRGKRPAASRPVSPLNNQPVPVAPVQNPPGKSPEPLGEPATVEELTRQCQLYAPEAVRVLRAVYKNTKASSGARVSAAAMVIDRAFGKVANAPQPVAKGGDDRRDLDQVSDAELASALKLIARRAGTQRGDATAPH